MKAKYLEVFHSIQGEGKYVGMPQVFVRLFECNMHCSWCDTPASIGDTSRNYKEATAQELVDQVNHIWGQAHCVTVTGGEPLLQVDFLKEFLPKLRQSDRRISVDTNATLPDHFNQVKGWIDIVAADLKLPSSTGEKAFWQEHKAFLQAAKHKDLFVKVIVSKATDLNEVRQAAELVVGVDDSIPFFVQPNFFEIKEGVVDVCLKAQSIAQEYLDDVRFIPQNHKFMKIR